MGRIYAIALNAYREAIRDRVLYGVVGFAVALLLFGTALGWIAISDQVQIIADMGIGTISLLANMVAIFLGASFLYKEIELRTLYVILAKPVARWQFVLGKYFGILTSVFVFITVTASLLFALLNFTTADLRPDQVTAVADRAPAWFASRGQRAAWLFGGLAVVLGVPLLASFVPAGRALWQRLGAAVSVLLSVGVFTLSAAVARVVAPTETSYVLLSCGLVFGEVTVTAAIAMFFSAFSTPFVTAMLTFGLFLVGRNAHLLSDIRMRTMPEEVKRLLAGIARVVPNLDLYVPGRLWVVPVDAPESGVWFVVRMALYGAGWAAVLLLFATLFFRRRDLV